MPALWITIVLLALATAYSAILVASKRRVPLWLIVVFAVLFMFGFLTWAAVGRGHPRDRPAVRLAEPRGPAHLRLARAACIGERVGVINIAIEGQLLAGAFTAAVVASITGQPWFGLIAAMVAGMLVGIVLAAFSIKYFVDQVIVGVVLNVLVIGLTSFFYSQVLAPERGSAEHAAPIRPPAHPAAQRHPDHRSGALPPDHRRLPHVRRRRAGLLRSLPHASGASASAPSASTRRPPTPSASRSTAPGSGTSRSPAPSPASAARSSRSAPASPSTRR